MASKFAPQHAKTGAISDESVILSILIVTWNTAAMTRDCLLSVQNSLGDLASEVILVDNGSNDDSADIFERDFPWVRLIRNVENLGFAAANNQAVAVARGRYMLLLNSDTLVHGDVLEQSVRFLERRGDVGVMGCRVLNADGTVQLTCSMYPSLVNLCLEASGLWKLRWPRFLGRFHMTHWRRDSEREVDTVSGCYLMLRRDVLDEIGPMDEAFFFFGEETDWCRRIRETNWKVVFAPVGEITHFGGGSVKKLNHRRDIMLSEAIVRLHRKHGGLPSALAAFAIVTAFNASRAMFWSLAALSGRNDHASERARHFRAVLKGGRAIWPGRPE